MLRIDVTGNLGQDSEVKQISGKDYHSFSIAHNQKRAGKDITTWISCLKRVGDNDKLGQYLKKGTQVFITGMPYASGYVKDSKAIADLNVFVSQLELLGSRSQTSPNSTNNNQSVQVEEGDDLPF